MPAQGLSRHSTSPLEHYAMIAKKPANRPKKSASPVPETVADLLAELDHPRLSDIVSLRKIILGADPSIAEGIKWNAPSFRTKEYFATINLRAKSSVELILHFGAKKNRISQTGVDIPDPEKLLSWLAKDRARVEFRDAADIKKKTSAFADLLRAWIKFV